jgi:branched-chain amino acid transport system permease protein
MKKFALLLLLLPFLFSCSTKPASAPIRVEQEQPSSPYDGDWQGGSGLLEDGSELTVSFKVESGQVAGITYQFEVPKKAPCFNTHYSVIPVEQRPQITEGGFTAQLGADMDVTTEFTSLDSASGHLSADIFYRYETCNRKFAVDWTAEKQPSIQIVESQPPARKNPFEVFFQILIFGLSNGAALALNAIGVTIIYGTVRALNLAHGDVFALASVLVTSLVNLIGIQRGWETSSLIISLSFVFLGVVAFGALLSVGVSQLGFQPFRGRSRLAPLIATLGLSFILYQAALVWRTLQASWIPGEHRSVPGLPEVPTDGIPSLLPEVNIFQVLHLPFQIVLRFSDVFVLLLAFIFVIVATWFLNKTSTGKAIRALSQNYVLAEMVGVNANKTINRAFAVGGALAGAAAFIFALYYGRPFGSHGAESGLLAFTAALLGGIGNPLGALLSSLFIGIFSSLNDYYFSAQWTNAILFVALLVLLVWRTSGSADAESAQVRDSVILPATGRGSGGRRQTLLFLAALTLIPILLQIFGLGGQIILRSAAIYILLAFGLNIVLGFTGLLDLGFAASFGLGAYGFALALRAGAGFWLSLLVGILAAGLLGAIKGLLARKVRDDFLAIATLVLGFLIQKLILNLDFTGGVDGFNGLTALRFPVSYLFAPTMNYFLVLGFVWLAAWLGVRLASSQTGRVWVASSEDETAALSSGVNVPRVRMTAFVLSSAIAGLAGALYAGTFTYVDTELFAFHVSTMILTMVILGGAGSVPGVMLGVVLIVGYDKVILPYLASLLALIWPHVAVGPVPNLRGASFFTFGLALYLTVLWRARKKIS